MKLIRRALVSAFAALALVVTPAVSAQAASISFDVTKLSAKSMVVTTSNCRNVEVNMSHQKTGVTAWNVTADINRSNGLADYAFFENGGNTKRSRALICPSWSGLGKYTIGPSEVWANNASYTKYVDRTDFTKGSFYIRGKAYASLSTKRSGKTVTLTSKTKVYNPEKYGKVSYSPKVKFQVKSGSKWKTIKTVTAKKGKATYKVKTKSKKSYRVTFSQSSWATGATSKSSKR